MRNSLAASLILMWAARATFAADLTVEVHDAAGIAVGDAVIYAEPASGAPPAAQPGARAIIDQVNKEFVPRVSIVQAGTSIHFPNSDNIRHSIYSFSPAKTFTTKLYSGREAAPVLFDKSGLVVLGCNIHDTMVAWVFIVDTPWFGRSAADGVGMIRDLPPGEYRLTIAAPAARLQANTQTLVIDGAASLHRSISLAAVL